MEAPFTGSVARTALPVAVIGAGPIGLAAAAHLLEKGETPLVLEAGESAGASIRRWGHVRLFSPWRYLVDTASVSLLERAGWELPEPDALPTGHELVDHYLEPLAALPAIRPHVRLNTRVVSVSRHGFDKMKSEGRSRAPFALRVRSAAGQESVLFARAVIDASGTYTMPNPVGASGVEAVGERSLSERVFYGIPDVLGPERARYAGRRVMVVGSGHSAFNALIDLAALAEEVPGTRITWTIRRPQHDALFGGESRDELPARGALGRRVRALVERGTVRLVRLRIAELRSTADGILALGEGDAVEPVDEIVATTGFRPDLAPLRELRLSLDPIVEAPPALAPLIDPNIHSCGSVPPHGALELEHPEPGLYLVGMKSYGRAPTFLLLTGYEQVRSVACALTGDLEGARAVELQLPETGVCSTGRGESECGDDDDEQPVAGAVLEGAFSAGGAGSPAERPAGARERLPVLAAAPGRSVCCG